MATSLFDRLFVNKHDTAKAYVHDWLEPDQNRINFFSGSIIALVLVSLVSLAVETEAIRPDAQLDRHIEPLVAAINTFIVFVFATEFSLRFWSEGENPRHAGVMGRLRFLAHPVTIADILAFLPELIVLLFLPHLHGGWLAGLRALRLARLMKLARYITAFRIVAEAVKRAWPPLFASMCIAGAQLYVAAVLLYFIEGPTKPQAFGSITRSLWWAVVTLTTVGYGDVFPETTAGRIVAGIVALTGVGIVALPTGILASSFAEVFREHYEEEKKRNAKPPHI
ncbi:MAG TPA: ion transporter [Vitreimonas sp.]|jgi:voltage-gated potassium channel|nr:ion transporter [Vitreimonas sp.]